ncbi:hypothetical protein BDZ94DRAFT_1312226 [Collybia nuda]|uniref:F-box domain-containing protein n=1 Tax=Collybia nuda TaxID=64659 RepID=A0A9P6CG34_9AGAR|nr:hypothetical protein BDZ94DRAFT_1312226 [Collybia nuda]
MSLELRACSPNTILSNTERGAMFDILSGLDGCIVGFDDDIARIRKVLDSLQDHRAEISVRAERIRERLALEAKLPPEILTKIFVHWAGNEYIKLPQTQGPFMAVSQVCSRWRGVALAEPLLWGRLYVLMPFSKQIASLVHSILSSRGGRGPVDLRINVYNSNHWEIMQNLVSTYPSRIRKLQIYTGSSRYLKAIVGPLKPMEIDHMRIFDKGSSDETNADLHVLEDCVNLEGIELMDDNDVPLPHTVIPWAQISRLTLLTSSPPAILSNILHRCPALVRIMVRTKKSNQNASSFPSRLCTLEHLAELYILGGDDVCHLLNFLVLPALNKVHFQDRIDWPQAEIKDLIQRSACRIEYFHTLHHIVPTEDIIPLMRAMPHVIEFRAKPIHPVSKPVFDTIIQEHLAPHLRTLTGWFIDRDSLDSAVAFLQSRWSKSASGEYEGVSYAHLPISQRTATDDDYLRKVLRGLNTKDRCVSFN